MKNSLVIVAMIALCGSLATAETARLDFTSKDNGKTESKTKTEERTAKKVLAPRIRAGSAQQTGLSEAQMDSAAKQQAPTMNALFNRNHQALVSTPKNQVEPGAKCDAGAAEALKGPIADGIVSPINGCVLTKFDDETRDKVAIPMANVMSRALGGKHWTEANEDEQIVAAKKCIEFLSGQLQVDLTVASEKFVGLAMVKEDDGTYSNCVFNDSVNSVIRKAKARLLN